MVPDGIDTGKVVEFGEEFYGSLSSGWSRRFIKNQRHYRSNIFISTQLSSAAMAVVSFYSVHFALAYLQG